MSRALTTQNVYDKKHITFKLSGVYKEVLGDPEKGGAWIIYGKDKNGKTWGTLLLCAYLSEQVYILFISAEQGLSKSFTDAVRRAKLDPTNKNIHFVGYIELAEIYTRLNRRNPPEVVVIDNLTFYTDELKAAAFKQLLKDFPKTTFIFLAHEERGMPYTATAKLCLKVAEIIIRVQGLLLIVSGRCPGGELAIDENKAALYHGQSLINKSA